MEKHSFKFSDRILVINNVKNMEKAIALAQKRKEDGTLTEFFVADDKANLVLNFFNLQKEEFILGDAKETYPHLTDEWVYLNAIGPLSAIYFCKTPYLLYQTGDVRLEHKSNWIPKAQKLMEKKQSYKVANLTWNGNFKEAKKEAYKKKRGFFIAKEGFSDQMFLVKREDFQRPIYHEIREDASHYPRGEVFEKRVYSYMKNHGWQRMTYKYGYYIHQ